MKKAGKVQRSVFPAALFTLLCFSLFFAGKSSAQSYPETTWVKVILYDYHTIRANDTDFTFPGDTCIYKKNGAASTVLGMVNGLSTDRKPVSVSTDCKTAAPFYPCACHLQNWFRVSGTMNSGTGNGADANSIFSCDSGQANPLAGSPFARGNATNPVWYWAQKAGGALAPYQGRTGEYVSATNYDSTNPFANVVVYDSLPFIHQLPLGTAAYRFEADSSTSQNVSGHFPGDNLGFFPLDGNSGSGGRGFGNETNFYGKATNGHNYGYTMEMHFKFLYTSGQGLFFNAAGDDDIWCFINGSQVIDLGGIKSAKSASVVLDNLGLTSGQYYTLDLFYCERNPTNSDINITSNIIPAQPRNIAEDTLVVPRFDTLIAGDTTPTIIAHVLDSNGLVDAAKSATVSWTEVSSTQFNGDNLLLYPNWIRVQGITNNADSAIRFTGTAALRTAIIVASYASASSNFACTTFVYVKPNKPNHILIENSSTPQTTSPNSNNPLGGTTQAITMGSGQLSDTGYVVWRDTFQNFVAFDTTVSWTLAPDGYNGVQTPDTLVCKITAPSGNNQLGEGIIRKGSDTTGKTNFVIATDPPTSKKDTVLVTCVGRPYDTIRIEVFNPSTGAFDTTGLNPLTLQAPDSITLYALAHRAGSNQWDVLSMNWFLSSNLATLKPAPSSQSSWIVSPADTGHGFIAIALPGNVGPPVDTIRVVFTLGLPNKLAIYPKADTPSATNAALAQSPAIADTFVAGVTDTLYAKLFFGNILYPNTSTLAPQITWTMSPAGGDTLLNGTNYFGIFRSTEAWRTLTVTAKWQSLTSTVLCRIKPGPISRVVIVGSPNISDSSGVTALAELTIPAADSIAYAYGVLIDAYSNYIGYATASKWSSTNTALTSVKADTTAEGEGLITKRLVSVSGMDSVIAYDTVHNLRDTLPVNCANYTFTSIQICNVQGTALTGDTVGVGSSSTLYAYGTPSTNGLPAQLVAVNWSNPAGLSLSPVAPSNVNNWDFTALSIGTGRIKISLTQGTTTLADSIPCVFIAGAASSMVLYRDAGTPVPAELFPAVDTIVSETTDTLDAKMFNNTGLWLSQYETSPTDTVIHWTIAKVSGPTGGGTDTVLTAKKGHITTFTPHSAYALYQISATYTQNGTTLTASAEIYVKPGAPTQLLIEASDIQVGTTSSNLLNYDHPISPPDTLRFGATDTTLYVWAVLRDKDSNFVQICQNPDWVSLNTQYVTAQQATTGLAGEGAITRASGATLGTTKVIATNNANLNESDTVNVALEAYSYSRLLIVVNNSIADSLHSNDTLRIASNQDTSIEVAALLSGGNWSTSTSIIADWAYLSNAGSTNQSAANTHEWTFSPGATGNGKIIVSAGSAIQDTITIKVTAGAAASVVLYDSMGPPSTTIVPFPNPTTAVNATAGVPYQLAAKVFDASGDYLSAYDNAAFNAQFQWSATNPPGDSLDPKGNSLNDSLDAGRLGVVQHFIDTRSNDSAYVIVQFDGTAMKDTVLIRVLPNSASHIVLEKTSAFDPHIPNPCDTLYIPSTSPTGSVYAILRDQFQNANGYDTAITSVGVLDLQGAIDTSVVSVHLYNKNIGQITAFRNASGTARLFATDAKGFSDTCLVQSLAYGYKALRIVNGSSVGPHITTPLSLTTDSSSTISVQALRTDTGLWVPVSATWQVSPGLAGLTPPAQQSSSFLVSPSDTGTGWVRVTLGDDSITSPDTLPVHFTPGAAVQAAIQILTPLSQCIAGQPIKAVVTLEDSHGNPVDVSSTAFSVSNGGGAYYADSRGSGGQPDPFLVADGNTIKLDHISPDSCSETFVNGTDTVSFTLYNAPPDSDFIVLTHQISVNLIAGGTTDTIKGVSPAFQLFPGPIVSLQMQTAGGTPIHVDTLTNDIPPSNTYFSRGYDQYGNLIGAMGSTWHVTGNLHAPTVNTVAVGAVFYSAVSDSQDGYLVAVYDTGSAVYSDSVHITIIGPSTALDSARTANWAGDGYLDHLTLYFSKKVLLDSSNIAAFAAGVKITNPSPGLFDSLSINTLAPPIPQSSSTTWVVSLNNKHSNFQTGWLPVISLSGILPAGIGDTSITALDGAGPVISRVVKQKLSNAGNTQDQVTITFSEPIRNLTPNNAAYVPGQLFDVWSRDSTTGGSVYVRDSATLGGIKYLSLFPNDTQAVFLMANDTNLTLGHYFSIDSANTYSGGTPLVSDNYNNQPAANNRKAPLTYNAPPAGPVIVSPNPMRHPGGSKSGGSSLQIQDNSNSSAGPVTTNNGGGVQMTFDVQVPDTGDTKVTVQASVAIYDILGNLVISGKNTRFIYYTSNGWMLDNGSGGELVANLTGTGNIVRPAIYWSGVNGRGMTVAPGVYRVVINLHYAGSGKKSYSDQKAIANIGVVHG